ncbi:hypothetical protein [Maribacter aestuarii]|uniref:hypothetical protein n=1 Tax=Maribacter aestuarii TaxID=1130723 RepID=UPI00248B6DFE|nr:hypothetical protein [Maribacter aestuarii]
MKKWVIGLTIVIALFLVLVYAAVSTTDKEFATCVLSDKSEMDNVDFKEYDSVLVAASTLYEGNFLKEIMQGEQYRDAWSTPIKVPIVFLDTLFGGMEILKEGGGKQTHSLKLKSKKGHIYSLRSINKDPAPLIPDLARTLGLENIIVDGVSAQHPYAAIVVARLAEKANVLHTDPKIVFIPEQPSLKNFNNKFGNRLYLLEHETDGGANWTEYSNVSAILDTEDLQKLKLELGDKLTIDKTALVRARLFDILIGDWDRHTKQWGWVVTKNLDTFEAIPLPGDRDNAFFILEGILPTIIANKHLLPGLQSFEKEIDYLPGLVMPFDVYFLQNVPEEIFVAEARRLQNLLTDDALKESLHIWPTEIYELDGEGISEIMKYRRNQMQEYAIRFNEVLEERKLLTEPLKGSEENQLPQDLLRCFDCF